MASCNYIYKNKNSYKEDEMAVLASFHKKVAQTLYSLDDNNVLEEVEDQAYDLKLKEVNEGSLIDAIGIINEVNNKRYDGQKIATLDSTDGTISIDITPIAARVLESHFADKKNTPLEEVPEIGEDDFDVRNLTRRNLNTLSGVRKQALSTIELQLNNLRRKFNSNPSQEALEELTKQVKEMEEIEASLKDLEKTENITAVLKYAEFVNNQLLSIERKIKEKNESLKINKNVGLSKIYVSLLNNYNNLVSSFSLVSDIRDAFDQDFLNESIENIGEEDSIQLKQWLDDSITRMSTISRQVRNSSINNLANIMAEYLNKAKTQEREKLEIAYNKLPKEIKANTTVSQYVEEEMSKISEAEFKQREYEIAKKALIKSTDIATIDYYIQSEKDINSVLIAAISKIIDEADIKKQQFIADTKIKAQEAWKDIGSKSTDPAKTFEKYYTKGSDGNLYITTKYSPEFYIEYRKLIAKRQEVFNKYGEKSSYYKEASETLKTWVSKNTDSKGFPNVKWLDKRYDSLKDKVSYKFIVEQSHQNSIKTMGIDNNIISYSTKDSEVVFIKAPNIGKSGFENLVSGNQLKNAWEQIQRVYKIREDDEEFGSTKTTKDESRRKKLYKEIERRIAAGEDVEELKDEVNMLVTLTNEIGDLKNQIPVFYRGQHDLDTISYDLISSLVMDSYMAENFHQKMKIKDTVELLRDVAREKQYIQTKGGKDFARQSGIGSLEEVRPFYGESNEYKKLVSMIENRIYGEKTIAEDFTKFFSSLMGWTAASMLGFNFTAGVANLLQGKVMNFMEGMVGQHVNKADLLAGEAEFFKDFGKVLGDVGKPVASSKTQLLLDLLNINGIYHNVSTKFNENNRFKALFKGSALYAANTMGEYYINSTLMYAMLNNIKVKNKEGQYIDKDGKVVTKEKAMSLNDAFSVKEGKLVLDERVGKTSFGSQNISLDLNKDKGLLEVRNLINKTAIDMFGLYDTEIQSHAQRRVMAKMIAMLRKWVVPGFNRRWRGATTALRRKELLRDEDRMYSEDKQSFDEGSYVSAIRFITALVRDLKRLGLQGAFSDNLDKLTLAEKANLKRTLIEVGTVMFTLAASMMIYTSLDGIDDDDEEWAVYTAFFTRRLFNELSFYMLPTSTFEILRSPAATLSYVESMFKFGTQLQEDMFRTVGGEGIELYERGRNKGLPKLWKRTTDLIPILGQFNTDIREKTSYSYMTKN